jgi:hypothetical protein
MNELRLTDTNAADDSAGSVWGLDGNLFMPVVAAAALSIGVILILFSFLHIVWWLSFPLGAVPFGLVLLYVLLLKQGKPPGYDRDLDRLAERFSGQASHLSGNSEFHAAGAAPVDL